MKNRFSVFLMMFIFVSVFALVASDAFGEIATLNPLKDNSIYEGTLPLSDDPDGTAENNSCGGGDVLFAGVTNPDKSGGSFIRRGLLKFDVSSIPSAAEITRVTLTLTIENTGDRDPATSTLHRLTSDWGEGTTDCTTVGKGGQGVDAAPGDATWQDAMFQQISWGAAGGDFVAASASALLPTSGDAVWDSIDIGNEALISDVQDWVDGTVDNYGWIVLGEEPADPATRGETARRFTSREGSSPPVLVVEFAIVGDPFACCLSIPDGDCQIVVETPTSLPAEQQCRDLGGTLSIGGEASCTPNPCPQPEGACCNPDESCSDYVDLAMTIPMDRATCEARGGVFNGQGSQCSDQPAAFDCGLTPFIDALPWPVPEVQPTSGQIGGESTYEITMSEVSQQLHSELPNTTVWGYEGSFPGPTLETTVDKPISVKVINNLPTTGHYLAVDTCPHGPNYWRDSSLTSVHLHGGHVPARFDGQPEYTFFPGEFDTYEYPNTQLPATLWYHDHALGITRLNVYMGLAAYYMLRPDCAVTPADPECLTSPPSPVSLPPKEYEVPAVIQDRKFSGDGSLKYPVRIQGGGFFGDKILVNGKVWPYLNVDQGKYRVRLLNGSQARMYKLKLENLADPAQIIPFHLIGTDGGLISAPIALDTITMVPAERFDVVIDFAGFPAGTEIVLRNEDTAPPFLPNVMKFIVQAQTGHTTPLPATLTTVDPIPERESAGTRYFNFVNVSEDCAGGEWIIQTLDGPDPARDTVIGEHWDDIDAFPVLGTTEVWEFINDSSMMHPMHVHLVQFQILDRCAFDGGGDGRGDCETLAPHEAGTWKDTVRVSPGTRVRVIMRFENYPGKFPAHCHLLDHEDHEMMRQFQTTWDPDLAVVDGICGPQEDCISNPDDCGTVPGNFCGNALCEIGDGEDFNNCPQDCNGSVVVGSQFNCGSDDPGDPGYNCGFDTDGYTVLDDRCITNGYFCRVKARVPACCGDSLCEGQETAANCATDCEVCTITEDPEVSCTDGEDNDCDGLVDGADPDCPDVCGDIKEKALCNDTPGCEWQGGKRSGMCVSICTITEDPEVSCFDNVDNDCDEATDCADTDCDLDAGPETTCGVGECAATGNLTCMGGAEVDTCTPGDPVPEVCDDPGMLDEDCDGYANEDDLDDCEVCQPTTNREGRDSSLECFDGEDNDCDTFLDCADPDCDGIKDSACDTGVPGICSIGELTCTGGAPECVQVVDPDVEGPFGDGTCDDGLDNDCDGLTDEAEDPDCQPPGIPCSDHTTRDECRNDPNCRWKKGDCINR